MSGFVLSAAAVAAGATAGLDRAILDAAQSIASPALDLAASIVTILGQTETTGVLALALALVWWRRLGARGLVPLLLFVGIGIEVAMKYVVPHPGPPHDLARDLQLLPFIKAVTPFAFPSGHVLRTTFLAALLAGRASTAWRVLLGSVVALMLATRIYLAEHWASDTVGGLFLGIALGALAVELGATASSRNR